MNNLTKLLDRMQHLRENDVEIPIDKFPEWTKVTAGCHIEIEWLLECDEDEFEPLVDKGYIFLLPGHIEPHIIDAVFTEGIVHIPFPDGVEKEANIPEWVPLVDLLNNFRVVSIRLV